MRHRTTNYIRAIIFHKNNHFWELFCIFAIQER